MRQPICEGIRFNPVYKLHQKIFKKKPFETLHHYISEHSTSHHTVLHTNKILRTKKNCVADCHMRQKMFYETNLPHSKLLHPPTLYTSSYTFAYKKFLHQTDFILKQITPSRIIFSWSHQEQAKPNTNSKFTWPCTYWTCYITTKVIYGFYYLLLILKVLLNFFSTITNSITHPHCLYIASFYCTSFLLIISLYFASITTLAKMRYS